MSRFSKITVFVTAATLCFACFALAGCSSGNSGGGSSEGAGKSSSVSFTPQTTPIQANGIYTYGLQSDGTLITSAEVTGGGNVVSTYGDFTKWKDISSFSTSSEGVAAILKGGSVVYCGGLVDELSNSDLKDVSKWSDVVQIAFGKHDIIGLKSDGSIVCAGTISTSELGDTKGYVQVECGCYPMAVKADGTVKVFKWSWADAPIDKVSSWTDIKSVSSSWDHIVALKSDGTVVAAGSNAYGECEVGGWTDIVAVSAGMNFTLGLKSDGTVVAAGLNENGQCDVGSWTGIAAIDAGYYHSVGMKSDGTVVASGANWQGQCNVSGWGLKAQ